MNDEPLVCLGRIAGAHGLRGDVRLQAFTDRPEEIGAYGPLRDSSGTRSFEIESVRAGGKALIVRLAGVHDRDAAEALGGTLLYVERARLPEPDAGEFYRADLVGMAVEDSGGGAIGTVAAVHNFGAGDLIEVERPGGDTVLLPFTREVVPEVDTRGRRLVADPPPGLLEPENGHG